MSEIHDALQSLGPTDSNNLPDDRQLKPYLEEAFKLAALIVDSVPNAPEPKATGRPRSSTTSSVTSSDARSGPPSSDREALQKNWKEVKLGQDNPHDIHIYKLSSKDGKGAWFARRSVHEGIGYSHFRRGLRREFEEGLKAREEEERNNDAETKGPTGDSGSMMMKPGVRGIAAERRVEHKVVKGLGRLDVYQLSAQFPGPTAPRDFVTMCLTTAHKHPPLSTTSTQMPTSSKPREFTMISRPFSHTNLPEKDGYVRGSYESVEFIREVFPEGSDPGQGQAGSRNKGHGKSRLKETLRDRTNGEGGQIDDASTQETEANNTEGAHDRETFPVEWIMITRSSPGGNVPRFMVERGTPGSIITDADKFLSWASQKQHDDRVSDDEATDEEQESNRNRRSRAQDSDDESTDSESDTSSLSSFKTASSGDLSQEGEHPLAATLAKPNNDASESSMLLQKLEDDQQKLDERLARREKDGSKESRELEKEIIRHRKLTEKHLRDAAKREEKNRRAQEKAEERRQREDRKLAERKMKLEAKDERVRMQRTNEALQSENGLLKKERDALQAELNSVRRDLEALQTGRVEATPRSSKEEVSYKRDSSPSASRSSMESHEPHGIKKVLAKVGIPIKETSTDDLVSPPSSSVSAPQVLGSEPPVGHNAAPAGVPNAPA